MLQVKKVADNISRGLIGISLVSPNFISSHSEGNKGESLITVERMIRKSITEYLDSTNSTMNA